MFSQEIKSSKLGIINGKQAIARELGSWLFGLTAIKSNTISSYVGKFFRKAVLKFNITNTTLLVVLKIKQIFLIVPIHTTVEQSSNSNSLHKIVGRMRYATSRSLEWIMNISVDILATKLLHIIILSLNFKYKLIRSSANDHFFLAALWRYRIFLRIAKFTAVANYNIILLEIKRKLLMLNWSDRMSRNIENQLEY